MRIAILLKEVEDIHIILQRMNDLRMELMISQDASDPFVLDI